MASVDFSNAVLEVSPNYGNDTISQSFVGIVGGLNGNNTYIIKWNDSELRTIATLVVSNITNTTTKLSYSFIGTFLEGGDHFYISSQVNNAPYWKVSNISFSEGDNFAFVIDIDISVS